MRALHLVMNPRAIPECIGSLERLPIDTCWLTGMTQEQLVPHVGQVVADTDYDAYLMTSDDCIVSDEALGAVLALLDAGHPAATGWCRLDATHEDVNLTSGPLLYSWPCDEAYSFRSYEQAAGWDDSPIPTFLMGMALTGMTRDLWLRFPYAVYGEGQGGWASDYSLSWRLMCSGIPMVAAPGGYVEHVKEHVGFPDSDPAKRLLIGEVEPSVRITETVGVG